jgi:hypothetical protein
MVDRQTLVWFRLPFVANPACAGRARWTFCIKPDQIPASAQPARVRNIAKIVQIIFSRSSRKRCTGPSLILDHARKQAQKRAFSIHGRDDVGRATDFMRVSRFQCRKAACHGRLRVSGAQDRPTLDGDWRGTGSNSPILRRKMPDCSPCLGRRPGAFVDTAGGRCYGFAPFPAHAGGISIVKFRRMS